MMSRRARGGRRMVFFGKDSAMAAMQTLLMVRGIILFDPPLPLVLSNSWYRHHTLCLQGGSPVLLGDSGLWMRLSTASCNGN